MFSAKSSAQPSNLFTMARSKLHSVVGGSGVKDNCSLHRWVLLKNSIVHSQPSPTPVNSPSDIIAEDVHGCTDVEDEDQDVYSGEEDMFVFPDAGVFLDHRESHATTSSESEWLDSLLESLGDEEDIDVSVSAVDDDDDPFTAPPSPMSSSDDSFSSDQSSSCYSPPESVHIPIHYLPLPYPPYRQPFIRSFELDNAKPSSPPDSCSSCEDPLLYADDVDDLSVPDAIEDVSDDESDAPSTPFARSTSSLMDPAAIPLPAERTRRPRHPQIYVDSDDSYFYPFELDPHPLAEGHVPSSVFTNMQEC